MKEDRPMNREIHFWFGKEYPESSLHSYCNTYDAIKEQLPRIDTTQVLLCSTSLFDEGYKIYIHPCFGEPFEVKLGEDEEHCNRPIKKGHNLWRLLLTGEWDDLDTVVTGYYRQ
jgi:hypothetical protein